MLRVVAYISDVIVTLRHRPLFERRHTSLYVYASHTHTHALTDTHTHALTDKQPQIYPYIYTGTFLSEYLAIASSECLEIG